MRAVRMLVASLAAVLAFGAAPAGAQSSQPCQPGGGTGQYPPKDCGIAADRSEARPGETITLTGQCPQGTQTVRFRLQPGGADLGTATPDSNGNYTKSVTIPAGTRAGDYRIEATCEGTQGAGVVRSVAIKVLAAAAAAPAPAGTLSLTGTSALPLAGGGVALVALGALVVLAVRRRREHNAVS